MSTRASSRSRYDDKPTIEIDPDGLNFLNVLNDLNIKF